MAEKEVMSLEDWVRWRKAQFDAESAVGCILTAAGLTNDCPAGPDKLPTYDGAGRMHEGTIFWMAKTVAGIEFGKAANRGAAKAAARRAVRQASPQPNVAISSPPVGSDSYEI